MPLPIALAIADVAKVRGLLSRIRSEGSLIVESQSLQRAMATLGEKEEQFADLREKRVKVMSDKIKIQAMIRWD